MTETKSTTKYRNPILSCRLFDDLLKWDYNEHHGKSGEYEVNVAGYSKDDISIEQDGNCVTILAENEHRGKAYHKFLIKETKEVNKVTYDNGLLVFEIGTSPEKSKKIKIN